MIKAQKKIRGSLKLEQKLLGGIFGFEKKAEREQLIGEKDYFKYVKIQWKFTDFWQQFILLKAEKIPVIKRSSCLQKSNVCLMQEKEVRSIQDKI